MISKLIFPVLMAVTFPLICSANVFSLPTKKDALSYPKNFRTCSAVLAEAPTNPNLVTSKRQSFLEATSSAEEKIRAILNHEGDITFLSVSDAFIVFFIKNSFGQKIYCKFSSRSSGESTAETSILSCTDKDKNSRFRAMASTSRLGVIDVNASTDAINRQDMPSETQPIVALANSTLLLDAFKDLNLISLATDEVSEYLNLVGNDINLISESLIILSNIIETIGFQVIDSSGQINECVLRKGFGGPSLMCSNLDGTKLTYFAEPTGFSNNFTIFINNL